MNCWAIIPVKSFRKGKSRLAGVLTEEERIGLNYYLLNHTLEILKDTPEIAHILMVSCDPAAFAIARNHEAHIVDEDGTPDINHALTQATRFVQPFTPDGLLIIPADLPLITPEDIRGMLNFVQKGSDPTSPLIQPIVVIAPDRHHQGTNGLLVCPPGLIAYDFGPGSFELHCMRARTVNAQLEIFENPAFALDVDLPEDLELIRKELPDSLRFRDFQGR